MSGDGSLNGTTFTMGLGATTLQAQWSLNTYTLTIDVNGGNFEGETLINVISGDTTLINNPTRSDYVFAGWKVSGSGSYINNLVFTMGTENTTILANWIKAVTEFEYTGTEQSFVVNYNGHYKLEVWGAQGNNASTYIGGYGGYSTGKIYLNENDKIYITVGGRSRYNGGGANVTETSTGKYGGTGGGATHIAKTSGLLSTLNNSIDSILIVAGGGGGGAYGDGNGTGGHGGGYQGNKGTGPNTPGAGATQVSGYSFGTGGNAISSWGAGGGGGYYGGVGGTYSSGGGGSGYIGNALLTDKYMYCYNCTTSLGDTSLTYSRNEFSLEATADMPKGGNGFARITLLDLDSEEYAKPNVGDEYLYDSILKQEIFNTPISGYYKLEVWGAQGNNASTYIGGYGGYSTGKIYLNENDKIYITVGGRSRYNGGGANVTETSTGKYGGTGGGATHIAKTSGLLSTLNNSIDSILIVAGGGGGGAYGDGNGTGGHGGGYQGNKGTGPNTPGAGATQVSGYSFGTGGNAISSWGAGGGGGYYGGVGGTYSSGGGGSGYIGNALLTDKYMYCYNCTISNDISTKTFTTTNVSEKPVTNYAKSGNGFARITYIGE